MKYVTFPITKIPSVTNNQWNFATIWKNNTNQYVLIEGLNFPTMGVPNNASVPSQITQAIFINDVNGYTIGCAQYFGEFITDQLGSTTVWNGTTMETESQSVPVVTYVYKDFSGQALIPPQCSLVFAAYTTGGGIFDFWGGWGFILDDNELRDFISGSKGNPLVVKL